MTSSMFLVNRQAFDRRREVLDKKISKWQIKQKGFIQSLIEATEYCCLNTTLHGLRNIYESVLEYNQCKSRYFDELKDIVKVIRVKFHHDLESSFTMTLTIQMLSVYLLSSINFGKLNSFILFQQSN